VSNQLIISIIIPVYNGEKFIRDCFNVLADQKDINKYEIVVVDDASTDNSINLLKSLNFENLKIFSLPKNSGPSAARNFGLKKSKGEYIYFFDVDDSIEKNALEILSDVARSTKCDYIFSDFKKIENKKNRRENKYNYPADKFFQELDIIDAMKRELNDASLGHLGLFGCNGRLIKRSLLIDNKIFFDENLRWM